MLNPGPHSLLRVKRDGVGGLFGKATIISTDGEAEAHVCKSESMLKYYRAFREKGHAIQDSLVLADRQWVSEVAEPELRSILSQLRGAK